MTKNHTTVQRHMWLLYADINTRTNLLVDECAHLQDTIFGFLEETEWEDLKLEPSQGGDRKWFAASIRNQTNYTAKSSQEVSLLNLWNSIGALAAGLDSVQTKVRDRYEKYLNAIAKPETASGTEMFWFLSLRGELVHSVFSFYLKQIQHAHETLVQLTENMPGTLPGPLLMRRWASAAYVELLSDYSRQVNWQTQDFMWRYVYGGDDASKAFETWRNYQHLTHTWSHEPTSLTSQHKLNLKDFAGVEESVTTARFQTIWSAYFYLEQPILLPLLYHECAHYHVDETLFTDSVPKDAGGGILIADKTLFDMKEELAAILKKVAKFQSPDSNFWRSFVEEVLMDVLAIHLGGKGYLAALALQLTGHSDGTSFSRFDIERDEIIALDEIGQYTREVRAIPYPILTPHYLWEARLGLAIKAYERLNEDADKDMTGGLSELIRQWHRSGEKVFEARLTSSEHRTFWAYRTQINDWVLSVCLAALEPHYIRFKQGERAPKLPLRDSLDRDIAEQICGAIRYYQTNVLGAKEQQSANLADSIQRLEDVAVCARWELSKCIVASLNEIGTGSGGQPSFGKYTQMYASYMRNDGSSAFRLAYEWLEAQKELARTVSHLLSDPHASSKLQIGKTTCKELLTALNSDLAQTDRLPDKDAIRSRLAHRISLKRRLEAEYLGKDLPILNATLAVVRRKLGEVAAAFRTCTVPEEQIRVGTLTLGVCRQVAHQRNGAATARPLEAALNDAELFHSEAHRLLTKVATRDWGLIPGFVNQFYPLLGDYSYINYLIGNTPAERDCHPSRTPKLLLKSRLVMQVFGDSHGLQSDKGDRPFARLVQLRFKYRWEWIDLVARLRRLHACSAKLFLSSGWEDAILVLWVHDEADWKWVAKELNLHHGKGLDSHSNIMLQKIPAGTAETETSDSLVDYLKADSGVNYLARTTGRYDLTVVWRDPNTSALLKVQDFAQMYFALGPGFWHHIGAITTSFEDRQKIPGQTEGTEVGPEPFEIASHILLRH